MSRVLCTAGRCHEPPHHGMVRWMVLILALGVAQAAIAAEAPKAATPADSGVALLQKIQSAARQLDYSGVFMYQQGKTMQSTRIVHIIDGTGERERLEVLDGAPREYIRHNDAVQCLVPEKKLVIRENRRGDRFPGFLIGDGRNIPANYVVKKAESLNRIAGRTCTMFELIPNDVHRYGYRLCADAKTNLLLKSQTLDAQGDVVDQVSFTSLQVGEKVSADQLSTPWKTEGWQVLETPMKPISLAKMGWRIASPPGFERITEVSRPMATGRQVSQMVLSDGLVAISIFIEPFDNDREQTSPRGALRKGAMNIFRTRIGDHWLTAIGEVPTETLYGIAQRTEYVPLAAPR